MKYLLFGTRVAAVMQAAGLIAALTFCSVSVAALVHPQTVTSSGSNNTSATAVVAHTPQRRGGVIPPDQRTPEERARIADFQRRINDQATGLRKGGLYTTETLSLPIFDTKTTSTASESMSTTASDQVEPSVVQ